MVAAEIRVTLPDGSDKRLPQGSTGADLAQAIGPGLAKAALAAKVDGEVRDIMRPFEGDVSGTAPYLFLPALYTLGSGLFLADVADGYWAVPGVLISAFLFAWFVFSVTAAILLIALYLPRQGGLSALLQALSYLLPSDPVIYAT